MNTAHRRASEARPRVVRCAVYTRKSTDACGLVQLASRTVGAPFVGATAATLVVSEVLRLLNGGVQVEVVDMTLHDPASRSVVPNYHNTRNMNPGFTR